MQHEPETLNTMSTVNGGMGLQTPFAASLYESPQVVISALFDTGEQLLLFLINFNVI